MFRRLKIACAVTAVVGGAPTVASAAPDDEAATTGCRGGGSVVDDEAARLKATGTVLCIVNRLRGRHNVRSLTASTPLASAATTHSADMVAGRYFSHTGADGSDVRRRVMRTGYIGRSPKAIIDETIAWGSGPLATPAQLVEAFMESPPHRRAVLRRRYRDVGVGLIVGAPQSGVWGPAATLTLDFGRR